MYISQAANTGCSSRIKGRTCPNSIRFSCLLFSEHRKPASLSTCVGIENFCAKQNIAATSEKRIWNTKILLGLEKSKYQKHATKQARNLWHVLFPKTFWTSELINRSPSHLRTNCHAFFLSHTLMRSRFLGRSCIIAI